MQRCSARFAIALGAALLAAAPAAHASVAGGTFAEIGDAGDHTSPQATIGSGPLGSITCDLGTSPADTADAFTFRFLPPPTGDSHLLVAFNWGSTPPPIGDRSVTLSLYRGDILLGSAFSADGSVRLLTTLDEGGLLTVEAMQPPPIGDPPYTISLIDLDPGSVLFAVEVPEPATPALLAAAIAALALARRRVRRPATGRPAVTQTL
jgi:hypothetical protein